MRRLVGAGEHMRERLWASVDMWAHVLFAPRRLPKVAVENAL